MHIRCPAHSKYAINVTSVKESGLFLFVLYVGSERWELQSRWKEMKQHWIQFTETNEKMFVRVVWELCGRSAFPFDRGTSLFVFIPLSWFREASGGKFSSRVTCFEREKCLVQLQKPLSFLSVLICTMWNLKEIGLTAKISASWHLFPGFNLLYFFSEKQENIPHPWLADRIPRHFYLCIMIKLVLEYSVK